MIRNCILACAAVCVALLAFGCGGDDTTVGTPLPRSPKPEATYEGATTGVPEIDAIVVAAASGNDIRLAEVTGYSLVPCVVERPNNGAPPECRSNEPADTAVEVLPSLGCERDWVRPAQAPDIYREALAGTPRTLTAVYRPLPGVRGVEADQVIVIATGAADAAALYVRAGRVVAVEQPCNGDTSVFVAADRIAESVYPVR